MAGNFHLRLSSLHLQIWCLMFDGRSIEYTSTFCKLAFLLQLCGNVHMTVYWRSLSLQLTPLARKNWRGKELALVLPYIPLTTKFVLAIANIDPCAPACRSCVSFESPQRRLLASYRLNRLRLRNNFPGELEVFRKLTDHLGAIYLKSINKNPKITTCNQLDLKTLH